MDQRARLLVLPLDCGKRTFNSQRIRSSKKSDKLFNSLAQEMTNFITYKNQVKTSDRVIMFADNKCRTTENYFCEQPWSINKLPIVFSNKQKLRMIIL